MVDVYLTVGIGLIFLIAGLSQLLNYLSFRRRSRRVHAAVVDLVGGAGANGKTDYYPVVEFVSLGGENIRATMRMGSNPPLAKPGERVIVRYEPDNPATADMVKHGWLSLLLALVLPTIGALALGFGIWGLLPVFF